jgi:hypothetical protein
MELGEKRGAIMKTSIWLGAAALGAMLSIGCQDNQALGTERTRDVVPAPLDPAIPNQPLQAREANPLPADPMNRPDQEGVGEAAKAEPISAKEPTAEAGSDLTQRSSDPIVDSSRASMTVTDYQNGEDLSDVPDQVGPLWAND